MLSAADLPPGRGRAPTSVLAVVLLLQALPFWPGHVLEEPSVSTEEDVLNSETQVGREVGLLLFSRILNITSVFEIYYKKPQVVLPGVHLSSIPIKGSGRGGIFSWSLLLFGRWESDPIHGYSNLGGFLYMTELPFGGDVAEVQAQGWLRL